MSTKQQILQDFLTDLFSEYHKQKIEYCLLRNYETLPEHLESRDIDIRIAATERPTNRKIINALAKKYGIQVYNHYIDERFDQFFLFKRISSYVFFSLKLDYYDLDLYGVRLLSGADTLQARIQYRNFYVASDTFKVLDKWLFIYLLGAPLPEKYHAEFKKIFVNHRESLTITLAKIFGRISGEQLVSHICSKGFADLPRMRKRELFCILTRLIFRNPLYHLWHIPFFLWYRLKHSINPKGEFISVSGPDGCGKSTVMELAKEQLEKLFGLVTDNHGHFRPSMLPRIAELAKRAGAITKVDENYDRPHRGKPSGFLGSLARFIYYLLDYLWGYFIKIRPALVRRELIIYDRYYFDMVADPGRSSISLPHWIRRFGLKIIPLPNTAFFVHAPAEIIRSRKQELSIEKIQDLNAAYLEMAKISRLEVIDNSSSAQDAAAQLVDIVIERRRKRHHLDRFDL